MEMLGVVGAVIKAPTGALQISKIPESMQQQSVNHYSWPRLSLNLPVNHRS